MIRSFLCTGSFLFFLFPLISSYAGAAEENPSLLISGGHNAVWSISAETGFQHVGLHFTAPFSTGPSGIELFHPSPLNLKLDNGNLWTVGMNAEVRKGLFSGGIDFKASIPRDTTSTTTSEPFWGGMQSVKWDADQVHWYALDAEAGVDVSTRFTLQVGLKMERVTMDLQNPVDSPGIIQTFHNVYHDVYLGNVESTLVAPWIGLQVKENRFKGALRFSPFAYADLKVPFDYYFDAAPGTLTFREQEKYSFNHFGTWLEGILGYDIYKSNSWNCSLWANASWFRAEGKTVATYQADQYPPLLPRRTIMTSDDAHKGTYTTTTYGLGLRVEYLF